MTNEEKMDFLIKGNELIRVANKFADTLDKWVLECKKYPNIYEESKSDKRFIKMEMDMERVSNRIGL